MSDQAVKGRPPAGDTCPRTRAGPLALIVTILRGILGAGVAMVALVILLALFYSLFIDLSSGETLRERPYGDALLVVFWCLSSALGGIVAGWRARTRFASALLAGLFLMIVFALARQVFIPPRELNEPAPAMVYWILVLLIPSALAGASLVSSRQR